MSKAPPPSVPSKSQLLSMTGYSTTEIPGSSLPFKAAKIQHSKLRIDLKALNHKFLEIKLRLPRELNGIEVPLRRYLQSRLSRGSVDCRLEWISTHEDDNSIDFEINLPLAAQYFESLNRLKKTLGLTDPILTRDLLTLPEVVQRRGVDLTETVEADALWEAITPSVQLAVDRFIESRLREGSAIQDFFQTSVETLQARVSKIEKERGASAARNSERIREKIASLFSLYPVQHGDLQSVLESRISQELALTLERLDVSEEIHRLKGHLVHFLDSLGSSDQKGGHGRKLEFILQEMHREINTLGSKAQDLGISEEVIQVKVEIDRLREQVLNVE